MEESKNWKIIVFISKIHFMQKKYFKFLNYRKVYFVILYIVIIG